MNVMRNKIAAAAMAAVLALMPAAEAHARGGFRGGGFRAAPSARSFGGSRSFGTTRSISTPKFNWGSSTKPKSAPKATTSTGAGATAGAKSLFGSRSSISGSRSSVSQQRGLYDSAKRNGTLFSSKEEATASFRQRYGKDYSSTFASEPAARPTYIPSSTVVGGRTVNVVYNPSLGGYGYLHPTLGTWMLFDAISDAATANALMSNRGYYWGGSPVYLSHGSSYVFLAFVVLIVMVGAAIAISLAARAARRRAEAPVERGFRGAGRY